MHAHIFYVYRVVRDPTREQCPEHPTVWHLDVHVGGTGAVKDGVVIGTYDARRRDGLPLHEVRLILLVPLLDRYRDRMDPVIGRSGRDAVPPRLKPTSQSGSHIHPGLG